MIDKSNESPHDSTHVSDAHKPAGDGGASEALSTAYRVMIHSYRSTAACQSTHLSSSMVDANLWSRSEFVSQYSGPGVTDPSSPM